MTLRVNHCGDVHLEEDRYFGDTVRCLEWFVCDGIRQKTDLFVIDGDLTSYKATIKERNLWIDTVIGMAEHAPVVIVSGPYPRRADWAGTPQEEGMQEAFVEQSRAPGKESHISVD